MFRIEPRTARRVSSGQFHPLGATLEPDGTNFALYSRHATEVWLLLFDRPDGEPTDVIRMVDRTRHVFHVFVEGVRAGQLYAYRVAGPFDPTRGQRFNPYKLLIDPYAKALTGKPRNEANVLLSYDVASPERDLSLDTRDSARWVPKSIVVDDAFDWQGDRPPNIPSEKLVLYEVHLKGFTAHPSSGVSKPGTYLGFIEKIPHLVELGVNAVELLPIHDRGVADFLREKGMTNYWGYDTLAFFAAESAYRSSDRPGAEVTEMKTLVRELHRAGIEVILDVVYNHTTEGNELGSTLSLRGVDNATYYALTGSPSEPGRYYSNWSGCGNCLNLSNAHVIRFVMDSLRYWAGEMHVDGFRFDLASALGREEGRFRSAASFFDTIAQDPMLSRVKLIAEPWDLGTYEVGNFPVDWSEWNGRFRDTIRKFEKGDVGQVPDLASRITGSSDLYGDDGRSAYNSVNFVTCHDGFTLWDLVSYDTKHNEANGEDNRDGSSDNHSWNSGAEGETSDPAVLKLRHRRAKNLVCDLLFSAGVPMLLGGDELLRTQRGNNNAYCQDNELGWIDWRGVERERGFLDFVKKAIRFTRRWPVLQRRRFFTGQDASGDGRPDIRWYGLDLDAPAWGDPDLRTLSYQLDGAESETVSGTWSGSAAEKPASQTGSYLLFVILNAHWAARTVRIPEPGDGRRWYRVVDTHRDAGDDFKAEGEEPLLDPQDHYVANARSTIVLLARR
jgi:glycogen operon protein